MIIFFFLQETKRCFFFTTLIKFIFTKILLLLVTFYFKSKTFRHAFQWLVTFSKTLHLLIVVVETVCGKYKLLLISICT